MTKYQKKKIYSGILGLILLLGAYLYNQFFEADNHLETEQVGDSKELDSVRFIRCVDGDTIMVEDSNGEKKRIRMSDCQTPLYASPAPA